MCKCWLLLLQDLYLPGSLLSMSGAEGPENGFRTSGSYCSRQGFPSDSHWGLSGNFKEEPQLWRVVPGGHAVKAAALLLSLFDVYQALGGLVHHWVFSAQRA